MFIRKDKYYELCEKEKLNEELEKQIKKLEYLLNTRERTCKIGAWCERCAHWVQERSEVVSEWINDYGIEDAYFGVPVPKTIGGRVGYCNKYIHTLCPDFKFEKEEK